MTKLIQLAFKRLLPVAQVLVLSLLLLLSASALAQQQNKKGGAASNPMMPTLARTTTRHETRRFAYGGTISIVGAPAGSLIIEAWPRSEVDITAEIELHAYAEEDFARLSAVNGFLFEEDVNHLRILTTGMHDKAFMKRAAKGFPKQLLGLPWKIDYRIRVPAITDLEIDMGRGPLSISGLEGAIRLNALESDATLVLGGGTVSATIGSGTVNINITTRSWRGSGIDIRLAAGEINLQLPAGFNGDLNADILRTGQIENEASSLEPRERPGLTKRSIRARAGAGGATFSFTVGDGKLTIKQK
ncbi:MAG TPA: hypothetical protein VGB17_03505 [Pyrinomonadaceae bacterium]|jgi:hypothetical protein